MVIEVTEEDILLGKREDCYKCPVARAVERATGEPCSVRGGYITFDEGQLRYPISVGAFTLRFDRGWMVTPFTFEIDYERDSRTCKHSTSPTGTTQVH